MNVKVSPIDTPEGMEFEGYVWEGEQAYAYFRWLREYQAPVRRPRPRGGRNTKYYEDIYGHAE